MTNPPLWIDKKIPYARSEGVQAIFGVSRETISKYVKNGMPFIKKGKSRIYNLKDVIEWKKEKDIEKSLKNIDNFSDGMDDDFENMPIEQINRALKVYAAKKLKHEASIKEIQEKVELKKYIPADKVDENMTYLLKEFITILRQIKDVIPTKIANMDEKEIDKILDDFFEGLLKKMNKAAHNV